MSGVWLIMVDLEVIHKDMPVHSQTTPRNLIHSLRRSFHETWKGRQEGTVMSERFHSVHIWE